MTAIFLSESSYMYWPSAAFYFLTITLHTVTHHVRNMFPDLFLITFEYPDFTFSRRLANLDITVSGWHLMTLRRSSCVSWVSCRASVWLLPCPSSASLLQTQRQNKKVKIKADWLTDWVRLNVPQTHYRSYRGRIFTGQMTQPTVSKHWRNTQN